MGFGRYALGTFEEPETKAFVQAALDEALKLERALSEFRTAATTHPSIMNDSDQKGIVVVDRDTGFIPHILR